MPAYFLAVLLTFIVWLVLFLSNSNARKGMVITGLLLAPFVILDIFTVPSYWNPKTFLNIPVGAEAFLFTFFIAGIAASIYETVFRKRIVYRECKLCIQNIIRLLAFPIPVFFIVKVFSFNVIYFFILCFLLCTMYQVYRRKDLILTSLFSSLLFLMIYYLTFSIWLTLVPSAASWWSPKLTYLSFTIIPLEELLFAISFGAFVGSFYKYAFNAGQVN